MVVANYEFEQEYSGPRRCGARSTGRCSAAPRDNSTATTTRGNSSTAGRTISIRPACRSCSTSRSCSSIGRGSTSSPTSDMSSLPTASALFLVRQRQRQRLRHGRQDLGWQARDRLPARRQHRHRRPRRASREKSRPSGTTRQRDGTRLCADRLSRKEESAASGHRRRMMQGTMTGYSC